MKSSEQILAEAEADAEMVRNLLNGSVTQEHIKTALHRCRLLHCALLRLDQDMVGVQRPRNGD